MGKGAKKAQKTKFAHTGVRFHEYFCSRSIAFPPNSGLDNATDHNKKVHQERTTKQSFRRRNSRTNPANENHISVYGSFRLLRGVVKRRVATKRKKKRIYKLAMHDSGSGCFAARTPWLACRGRALTAIHTQSTLRKFR